MTQVSATGPAQHTVEWYKLHQQARQDMLQTCQNDHSLDGMGDCHNAISAAHAAAAAIFSLPGPPDAEAHPSYYRHDAGMIAMMISMCDRNAAPAAWCQAARTAAANQKH